MNSFFRANQPRIAFVSTYRPRQCGIATFTEDLRRAIPGNHRVIAIEREPSVSPAEVICSIRQDDQLSYVRAARLANETVDAVSLQHEYGIFGGDDGQYVLDFVNALSIPVIVTLHTVLPTPSENQRRIVQELGRTCSRVMVMAQRAVPILETAYGLHPSKVLVIPHGVPKPEGVAPAFELAHLEKDRTLLTFGLLSPGKGIETAIRAVAELRHEFPTLHYIVLGATHPELKRREGETYRESLQRLTVELEAERHVTFVDQYTPNRELYRFLAGAGIYVTPYRGADQIVSGTLAYAAGFGLPIVSTPFAYARELANAGAAALFPFDDHWALAQQLRELLSDRVSRRRLAHAAFSLGLTMRWPVVGAALAEALAQSTRPVMLRCRSDSMLAKTGWVGVRRPAAPSLGFTKNVS